MKKHIENCIFCKIIKGEIPSYKVYEDENTYVFFDINPINEYHALVIPKSHYKDIFDVPENEALHIMKTIKTIVNIYNEQLGIKNVQIINNSGAEAQQDVFHIHFHIVPRLNGDGQNLGLKRHPELQSKLNDLLSKLNC